MRIHKLSSTDAFVAFDLQTADGDAPAAGVVRRARKVLQDGAQLLARSTTYSFASFGLQYGGASAGINAEDDDAEAAVAAFVGEVEPLVSAGTWSPAPALGIDPAAFGPLAAADARHVDAAEVDRLTGGGAVAAAAAARTGGLNGARVAFAGKGGAVEAARKVVEALGATVVDGWFDADADVLFIAGKAGAMDHEAAETVKASVVVPLSAVPITARAHAVLSRAETVHVPDFLSIAAPLLAGFDPDGGDPVERVGGAVAALASHGTKLWMAAVDEAEAYLKSWQDELPFGRPLA